ncbi:MAG: B12-binding domain-containing radical SAM protein [Bacteroidales bacterium]
MIHKLLLISPPFTQLNTPYPATAYLKGFLNTLAVDSVQIDLSLETILALFSQKGLSRMFDQVSAKALSPNAERIYALRSEYLHTIEPVIAFLQGKQQTLAQLIAEEEFLPRAAHFNQETDLEWAFGAMGFRDKARHLCTLYLEDLCDFIIETTDAHFGFSRYAEQLGRYAGSFDELHAELQKSPTYIDRLMIDILERTIRKENPTMVCITIPFPGNLYSALRCGQYIKKHYPDIRVEMGGGFPNTELRSLSDPRVFDYTDYILLDDGEAPLKRLMAYLAGDLPESKLMRTYFRKENVVTYVNDPDAKDIPFGETGTPCYEGLPLGQYLSVIEVVNPMHKLWSDGRWNKLTFAHGCYWGKCAFCDGTLDYIKRYEPASAKITVDRMEQLIATTGESGFHFVDEAAPPVLMREVALEILRRGLKVTWWTNVRFEKSFSADLCRLLKAAGCIAVSGGLEVASDRLLKLINKGVTVEQVAKVASNFTEAGIMVHAYLMYGFPTQTAQETIDSLEVVRQLFAAGIVQSGFWHRFAMTAHSPVGQDPAAFRTIACESGFAGFADNDRLFEDPEGTDHSLFGDGLRKSLFNFMHGIGFDFPLRDWFDFRVPVTTVSPQRIQAAVNRQTTWQEMMQRRLVWIGNEVMTKEVETHKKGKTQNWCQLTIHNRTEEVDFRMKMEAGYTLAALLNEIRPAVGRKLTLAQFEEEMKGVLPVTFSKFMDSEDMQDLFSTGLLLL